MSYSRRSFLGGLGAAPLWMQRAALGQPSPSGRKKVLVAIFQRGAADGLNIVIPHGEPRYYQVRPTISVPKPTARIPADDALIDLDGFFGLNPALASFKPLYEKGHLAMVQAVGSPDPSRSHFEGQDFMESGTPGFRATDDGWLNRALPKASDAVPAIRAVSIGPALSRSLRGRNDAIALEKLDGFRLPGADNPKTFESLYLQSGDAVLKGVGRQAFDAASLLAAIPARYEPAHGVRYPGGKLGAGLRQIAQLIKADVGIEVAFAESPGWDHHTNEVGRRPSLGQLAVYLRDLADSMTAFYHDLGDRMADVVVVTMSEFGRTVEENGNRGTDHGHGNVMFVLGGNVQGGKVHGKWPGLAKEQLYDERDLAITTDFRDVLGELTYSHLGNRQLSTVFPGYTGSGRFPGLVRA